MRNKQHNNIKKIFGHATINEKIFSRELSAKGAQEDTGLANFFQYISVNRNFVEIIANPLSSRALDRRECQADRRGEGALGKQGDVLQEEQYGNSDSDKGMQFVCKSAV